MDLTFTHCSPTSPKHPSPPLTPAFLSLFTTHLFSFSAFYEEGRSTEGEKLLGDLLLTVSYKEHQVKVDDCRADYRIRLTCPWTGSTASARSCVSREDFSGLPAVPPDEFCSDEAAAKSLSSQTSLTWEAP